MLNTNFYNLQNNVTETSCKTYRKKAKCPCQSHKAITFQSGLLFFPKALNICSGVEGDHFFKNRNISRIRFGTQTRYLIMTHSWH